MNNSTTKIEGTINTCEFGFGISADDGSRGAESGSGGGCCCCCCCCCCGSGK